MDEPSIKLKMEQVLNAVSLDLGSIRTGRASASLVENLQVMVYGGQQRMKILELGSINASDPQAIVIDLWDKSIIGDVRKGIQEANIGLNPSIDGEVIRISIPPMTTEDRAKFVKLLGTKLEAGKVQIRQIRADYMHGIKESFEKKEITEDDRFLQEKRLQEFTDLYVGKIEEMGQKKQEELMQI